MSSLDDITNKHNEEHNLKRPYIPDHPYSMLIIRWSQSGKTNSLIILINKTYWQDLFVFQRLKWTKISFFLIKKRKVIEIKHLNDPKVCIIYSQCMDDVHNNINDYNPSRKEF